MMDSNNVGQDQAALVDQVVQSRAGGRVERCHIIPHQGSYNNAAHSWGVAMLLWYLWPDDFQRLVVYCLSHDVPEYLTGDMPASTKRAVPGLGERMEEVEGRINIRVGLPAMVNLPDEDKAKINACDLLEFYLWTREQLEAGNNFVHEAKACLEMHIASSQLPRRAMDFYITARQRSVLPQQAGIIQEIVNELENKNA